MKTEPNDPIMFCDALIEDGTEYLEFINESIPKYKQQQYLGLTKREYFAAMFMQLLITSYEKNKDKGYLRFDVNDKIPKSAIMYADALINELNKK